MSLFSSLVNHGEPKFDVPVAAMIPCVSAVLADGNVDDDEVSQIRSICIWSPLFASNSSEEDTAIIRKAVHLVDDHGAEAMCANAREVLGAELCETAFSFACRIVFADGHVGTKEMEFLEQLVVWLGIDEAIAQTIVLGTQISFRSR